MWPGRGRRRVGVALRFAALTACALGFTCAYGQSAGEQALPGPSPLERQLVPAKFRLGAVAIRGATVIPESDIQAVLAPFIGQLVGAEELHEIVRRIDALYDARGFVGSRAHLADQNVSNGTVRIDVIELRVSRVEVAGTLWNRANYVSLATWPSSSEVVSLPKVQERLAGLKETGLFERIDADLRLASPGDEGAKIHVSVIETPPLWIGLSAANDRPPSIGAIRRQLELVDRSLLGWGDAIDVKLGKTNGLNDSDIGYVFPVVATPISIFAKRTRSDSLAIEPPVFRDLDIVALSDIDAVGATLALLKSERLAVSVGASGEKRKTTTTLLGLPFSFTPGLPDQPSYARVARGSIEGLWRGEGVSASCRVGYSRGHIEETIPTLDGSGVQPSYHFWQVGLGGVGRTGAVGELRFRGEVQIAQQTLPPTERIAIGGATTVRGYRENLLLRDSGAMGSIEWHWPKAWSWSALTVGGGAFLDGGWARNHTGRSDGLPSAIASVGIDLEATIWKYVRISTAYAVPNHRNLTPHDDLQDRGFHWGASISYP